MATGTGGYDYAFAEDVPDDYKCQHCHKVLRNPHLIQCCGGRCCESCLQELLRTKGKRKCPFCGDTTRQEFQHILDKPRTQKINEMMICCTNYTVGCETVFPLQALKRHLDQKNDEGCGYIKVSCTIKCGRRFYRKDLQNHLENECRLREYTCQHDGCDCKDTYERVTGEHKRKCPHHPFDCPNRCGRRQIKRKDIPAHQETCPKQPVDCPYRPAGCNMPLVREDVQRHLERSRDTHSLQLMGAITTMTSSVQAEITTLKSRIRDKATTASLSCIETHLRLGKRTLQKIGDTISVRMTGISEHMGTGQIWYSPPFYYMDGYKMKLAVHFDPAREVSLSLILLKGEYDDRLRWPIAADVLNREQLEVERYIPVRVRGFLVPPLWQQLTFTRVLIDFINEADRKIHVKPTVRKHAISKALNRLNQPQAMSSDLEKSPDVLIIVVDVVSPRGDCRDVNLACWPLGVTQVLHESEHRPLTTLEGHDDTFRVYPYLHNDSIILSVSIV